MRRARLLAPLALLSAIACLPSPGPFQLDAVRGRVVEKESGAPVADVLVVEVFRGATTPGATPPVYHSRFTHSGPDGRFEFPRELATSLRMWLLETYAPTYELYHPEFGLQRDRTRDGQTLVLTLARDRAEAARADLREYCRSGRDDPGARRIAERGCNTFPSRPRARTDARTP